MSNIRDLQRLRGTKNQSVLAQTSYNQPFNPQNKRSYYQHFLEKSPILTNRSPRKVGKQTDDSSKSPSRLPIHKRTGSFGLNFGEDNSSVIFQNPRVSIYNVSMKLADSKKCDSPTLLNFPNTERKPKDNFFQVSQVPVTRKKSSLASSPSKTLEITRKNFNVLYPIGKGGFGKVWKVQTKKGHLVYAMKEMSKAKIINKKSVQSVMNQKQFLTRLNHPFLVNMTSAFQDRENLYLIMDYLDGGDLRYHLGNKRSFNQKQTKFFLVNLILGLEYMHKNKIIHRDIKPENLVLDSKGYLRITDMGISREQRPNNSTDTSGTPGYMAPEVMSRKEHSYGVDYFAMGVIAYEFMLGTRPYLGKDRKQIREKMLAKQAQVRIDQLPYRWSPHALDFINRLLLRNPDSRLGARGIQEIKEHAWLADVDWQRIYSKKYKAPFIPINIQQDYDNYKQQISEDTIVQNQQQILLMLRDHQTQSLFDGYYYQRRENSPRKMTSTTTNYTDQGFKRR